jgi:hypothetical protein
MHADRVGGDPIRDVLKGIQPTAQLDRRGAVAPGRVVLVVTQIRQVLDRRTERVDQAPQVPAQPVERNVRRGVDGGDREQIDRSVGRGVGGIGSGLV